MDIPEIATPADEFDWTAYSLTPMQILYCKARARGLNRTKAAIEAGYSKGRGDPGSNTLRSTASSVEKSRNVALALNAWRVWNGEKSEVSLDDDEVDKELSRIARTATSETARLQALKFISERNQARREIANHVVVTADLIREQLQDIIGAAACSRLIAYFGFQEGRKVNGKADHMEIGT